MRLIRLLPTPLKESLSSYRRLLPSKVTWYHDHDCCGALAKRTLKEAVKATREALLLLPPPVESRGVARSSASSWRGWSPPRIVWSSSSSSSIKR